MPDNEVWPPKPSLLDPLAEYDELIAAKLAAFPTEEPEQMRFRLIIALQGEGVSVIRAISVVNDYCNRHGVLVSSKANQAFKWSNFGLVLVAMLLLIFNLYLTYRRDTILGMPHTHAAFLAFRRDQLAISYMVLALISANIIVLITRFRYNHKRTAG